MTSEKEKNNREELFKLMQENPDLPIVPMVDSYVVADDGGYWLGSWGGSYVDEYFYSEQAERLRNCLEADTKTPLETPTKKQEVATEATVAQFKSLADYTEAELLAELMRRQAVNA